MISKTVMTRAKLPHMPASGNGGSKDSDTTSQADGQTFTPASDESMDECIGFFCFAWCQLSVYIYLLLSSKSKLV
jgi:hypothetical protein